MSAMSFHLNDRLFWLAVAASALAIGYSAVAAVQHLQEATETTVPTKPVCVVSDETENDVSPSSLLVLMRHPSYHVRESAIKLLVHRAIKSTACLESINADYNSDDAAVRARAMAGLKLIQRYKPPHAPDFYSTPSSQRLRANTQSRHMSAHDDQGDTQSQSWTEGWVQHGQAWPGDTPVPRARSESPEEQARRRRRREAVVVNEGDRPVTQEDIIQRGRSD